MAPPDRGTEDSSAGRLLDDYHIGTQELDNTPHDTGRCGERRSALALDPRLPPSLDWPTVPTDALTTTIQPAIATRGDDPDGSPFGNEQPGPEHEALWFALARRRVNSVVLLPADEAVDVEAVARATHLLANVGRRLGDLPVTTIVMHPSDYGYLSRTAAVLASTRDDGHAWPGASPLSVIVAIGSVLTEPLGLGLVQAADAVILCIQDGKTTIPRARETIERVGADRIAGCVMIG